MISPVPLPLQLPTSVLHQLQAAMCALLRTASVDACFEEISLPKLSREPQPTVPDAVGKTIPVRAFVTSFLDQLNRDLSTVRLEKHLCSELRGRFFCP